MGIPSQGFWSDNGKEFQNNTMLDLVDKFGLSLKFGPSYSPWAKGINERNHGIADKIMQKLMESDKSLTYDQAVKVAAWGHNTNVNK